MNSDPKHAHMLHLLPTFHSSFENKVRLLVETKRWDWLIQEVDQKTCSGFIRRQVFENKDFIQAQPNYVLQRAERELLREFAWSMQRVCERILGSEKLRKHLLEKSVKVFLKFQTVLNEEFEQEYAVSDQGQSEVYEFKTHDMSLDFQKDINNRPLFSYKLGIEGLLYEAMQACSSLGDKYFSKPKFEQVCNNFISNT